jgi:hypothetical protein
MSVTYEDNPQNPLVRRAYYVRPKPELAKLLESMGMADAFEFLGEAGVVMTEALPWEGRLEGYRSLILTKCKQAFLNAKFEDWPSSELPLLEMSLGKDVMGKLDFDRWWTAEEVDVTEVETSW